MLYSRLTGALLCGAVLLSLAACSDPGGVGANVGREPLSGENPSETTVMAVPTSDTTEASLTGLDGQGRSWRFLVGNVSDNLDGRLTNNLEIEADGYVDIGGPSASNPFSNTSASELNASLRLVPTYRHGDTTATLDMELCDLQSSGVDMGRTRADESFATSNRIQSYSISPADLSAPLDQDTVTLDLPQSWIDNNASALKSDDDNLNGFKLAPTGSNTVIVGFQHGSATLRVTTNSDTADFGVQQSFTHIGETSGSTPTVSSPNQRLLLDGVGRGLAFNWTKSDKFAALTDSVVVSRAQIRASFDTGIYESNNTPSDFVRPSASDYRILATRRSGGPSCSTLDLSKLNDDTCVFPMEASEGPGDAQSDRGSTIDTFDRWLSGERPLDAFRLGIALLPALLLLPGLAHAQSNGDGSIYSRFGLGSLQNFSSPQSQAVGGGAYAVRSLNYNPTVNPALWSDQVYTRLSLGGSYETVRATTDQGNTSQLVAGTIEALQFSFPLYKRKLGVGLSFQPFTQHNYRSRQGGPLPGANGSSFDQSFRGGGGLYSARGGLGYRINEILRIGASVDVLFGILERKRNTTFEEDDGPQEIRVSDKTRLAGVSGTLGAHLALAGVLTSDDALSIGGAVSLPTTLNGERVLIRSEQRGVSSDTLSGPIDGDVSIPWRGRLGVAYQPDGRWTITVDGLYEPWSAFSSSFSSPSAFGQGIPTGGEETLTDRWRVSTGTELVPAGDDQFTGYFQRVAYRLGAYTERLYVQPDGTTNLQTYAVTGGLSLPTALSGTRIDLNVRAGTRGTTADALVRDRFYGVSLHVNFGEEWFQERKLR